MATDTAQKPNASPLSGATAAPPLPGGETAAPADMGGALQDLLPEIHALAQRCGGLDKLARIVENLRSAKPV